MSYDEEAGDDGRRIENCRSWANYESHSIGLCEMTADDIISALEKVETGLVRQWRYIDGKPFIAAKRFK